MSLNQTKYISLSMNVLVTVNNRAKFISLKKKKKLENKLNSFFCFHNYFQEYRKEKKNHRKASFVMLLKKK